MTEFDGNPQRRLEGGPVVSGPASIDWAKVQKLVKLLPAPANADRFLQIVNSMAAKQQAA